uniref:Uncharacterized protein n=1 Tax=Candidatus Kentrum sp. MB TaxID=2138164 RepID=A0A450XP13_9GAMM|nr:MAG: hypothetical protein BECKMB1821G_GA0114241_107512 [Candidatus Kentron sp. MB]
MNKSIVPFTLALLFAAPILADDCFCLIDEDDSIRFDCRIEQPTETSPARYFCANPETGDEPLQIFNEDSLTRIPSGEPPCTPCRLSDVDKASPNIIRHGP